jgi:hypothetical protein
MVMVWASAFVDPANAPESNVKLNAASRMPLATVTRVLILLDLPSPFG